MSTWSVIVIGVVCLLIGYFAGLCKGIDWDRRADIKDWQHDV